MSDKTSLGSSWNISEFYKKAWNLTKTHKKLWILGFAVALYSGSSGNNDFDFGNDRSETQEETSERREVNTDTETTVDGDGEYSLDAGSESNVVSETVESAVGLAGSEFLEHPVVSEVIQELSEVSPATYAGVALSFLALLIATIVLSLAVNAWANAALIHAVANAVNTDSVDLRASALVGWQKIKPWVWLHLVPIFKALLLFVGVTFVATLVSLVHEALAVVGLIGGFLYFIYFIRQIIHIAAAVVLGERFLVFNDVTGREAFESGKEASQGVKWRMFILGVANNLLVGLAMVLVLAPFGALGLAAVLGGGGLDNLGTILPGLVAGGLLLLPLMFFLQALFQVFVFTAWHHAYQVITDKS